MNDVLFACMKAAANREDKPQWHPKSDTVIFPNGWNGYRNKTEVASAQKEYERRALELAETGVA